MRICQFLVGHCPLWGYYFPAMLATPEDMPVLGNTCTESTFFLWCWPHLNICPFLCDMSNAESSIVMWCRRHPRIWQFSCDMSSVTVASYCSHAGHIWRYSTCHVICPVHCWKFHIPVMLAASEDMQAFLCNTCVESTFFLWCCDHISRYAPFHAIWPLPRVLNTCHAGNIWEYANFSVVCHCPLMRVPCSCDAGNIREYTVIMWYVYCIEFYIPVMLATSENIL